MISRFLFVQKSKYPTKYPIKNILIFLGFWLGEIRYTQSKIGAAYIVMIFAASFSFGKCAGTPAAVFLVGVLGEFSLLIGVQGEWWWIRCADHGSGGSRDGVRCERQQLEGCFRLLWCELRGARVRASRW